MASELLERDEELARIAAAVRRARDGFGTLIVVEGPAGMGKTEVLRAARAAAEADGLRVLRSRGAELERDFPFGVVRQLFEPALAEAGAGERADVLQGPAALAAGALSLPGGEPGAVGPEQGFAVLHGLYWLCANLATARPLVLAVDDVHWADAPTLRYLAFLLARLEELPVAILAGARPEYDGPGADLVGALVTDPGAEHVRLAPLSAGAVARLLEDGLGVAPDPEFAEACRQATGGVPLLVRALVRALRDDGVEPVAAAAAQVEHVGARTVGRWVQARLARLPAPAGQLARALAILERGDLATTAALAGWPAREPFLDAHSFADPAQFADLLVGAGIVEPSRPLTFVHPIIRAGVYSEISEADRAKGHRRAAELLAGAGASDMRVAEHLLSAPLAGDPWVVERLRAAAAVASGSGAPDTAAVLLRRALAEPPDAATRPGLALELGLAEASTDDPQWQEHLELALDTAPDDSTRVASAMVLGYALLRSQRSPEAVRVLDRTAARVGEPARPTLEAAAIISGLVDARTAPLLERRLLALRESVEHDPDAPRDALALAAYSAGLVTVPADTVARLALRALDAGPRRLPLPTDGPWFAQVSVALLFAERYRELDGLLEVAIAEARATGDGALFSGAVAHRAWLALRRGDLGAAEGDTRTALEARDLPIPTLYRLLAQAAMTDAVRMRGDLEEAERIIASAGADVESRTVTAGVLRAARGRLRLAQGRPQEALADALAAGEVALGTLSSSPSCIPWRSDAAHAHLALGDRAAAERLAEEELRDARIVGAPRVLGISLHTLGVARESEELLREALAALETSEVKLINVRTQLDLGILVRRAGRAEEAREILRGALDTAHRLGAVPVADRAEAELRASGAKPRRAQLTGLAALTASERRVAELAGQGMTNREIAQALFVTARTVEGHLTQVFRKLDVPSRDGLINALAA